MNMMYPRLRLAANLLRDDGVIFISIDDNEVTNLRKLCDEVFGEENFVAQVIVQTNPRGRTFDRFIAKTHEYLLVYTKNIDIDGLHEVPKDEKAIAEYNKEDANGKYRLLELRNRNPVFNRSNRPLMFYPLYANPETLEVSLTKTDKHTIEIFPRNSQGEDGCWTWGREKATNYTNLLVAKLDIDKLLSLCGEYIDNDFEKYKFEWKGKSECYKIAGKRSTGTLRPCVQESVDFENTNNLYIEGDNLEVLKLLQNAYYRKVKMIYIDPPYNTGNDFVYEDDYKDPLAKYKEITSQTTKSNPETMGRYIGF